jgi:hypothetical protein
MKSLHLLIALSIISLRANSQPAKNDDRSADRASLSKLNAQFIKNYINHDTIAHNEIIHKDFVCIENNGAIESRKEYMKVWAVDYPSSGFTSFGHTDEYIRFFGDVALVRSKSFYTRIKNGKSINGSSIYTDTYKKENGRWWCIQAQITPNMSE